jgi:cation:H+ antiporter
MFIAILVLEAYVLEVIFWICLFVLAIFVLVKASGFFIDAAEKVGVWFGLSPFIIGVTIVAIGTSLPELVFSFMAVSMGSPEIVVSTVVGSNIADLLLILGVVAIIGRKMEIAHELIKVDLPLLVGSSLLLAFMVWDGVLVWFEAVLLLLLLVVYLTYTVVSERHSDKEIKLEFKAEEQEMKSDLRQEKIPWLTFVILLMSGLFVFLGAKFTVQSVLHITDLLGIATEVFVLSIVALGNTLPEMSVSVTAARKKKAEMAVGNVLGSCIFNNLAVMSIPALFVALPIHDAVRFFALPVMLAGTLLFVFMTQDKQITKWEGWLLIIFYVFFLVKILGF